MRVIRGLIVLAAFALAAPALADHHEGAKKDAPSMTPEDVQKYMEAYATPGPEHKVLAYNIGEWNAEQKMMFPGMEPTTENGKATFKWSLDGRYIVGNYDGMFMGSPFHGMDVTGYDRIKKQYFNIWFDTMGTGYLLSHGQASDDGKVITLIGTSPDPMTGGEVTYRMVSSKKSDDLFTFEMYQSAQGMDEAKTMVITYTRAGKKAAAK